MKDKQANIQRCLSYLAVWLCLILFAAMSLAPGLSRISYPQLVDFLPLIAIPVSAFHASKYYDSRTLFTTYGCVASGIFWMLYHSDSTSLWCEDSVFVGRILISCVVTVMLAGSCRFAAALRSRWDGRLRFPPGDCQDCGYDLTGNVSGVCPECGTANVDHAPPAETHTETNGS